MIILVDKNIPFLSGVLDSYATVQYIEPEEFTHERVRDASVLIIRTRTRCDRKLLEGSKVEFIATATIGFDHIDTAYCQSAGIAWTACPGCNAQAVADYVEEALCETGFLHQGTSLGIVGVGHVGEKVKAMAERHGLQVALNDPLRGMLDDVRSCEVITFHTPLTYGSRSRFPTYHLCDETFLKACGRDTMIINAARGGVVDEQALIDYHQPCVIDCWEGEPAIRQDLLLRAQTQLASFHIAGYSIQGKRNASQMCLDALTRYYAWPSLPVIPEFFPKGDTAEGWLMRVTKQLKEHPDVFEKLRKNYLLR